MEAASKREDLVLKYGIKITVNEKLTKKAIKVKAGLENDPIIVASRRLVGKLNLK